MFKPTTTPFTAPIYAVLQRLFLRALSPKINNRYPGIMVNVLLLSFGVLAVMLLLYVTRIIRVTSTLVKGVLMATASVALVYVVDMIMGMFGTRVPYIHETGMIGVTISLVIVGIAAFNLLIDF